MNGKPIQARVEPRRILARFLREDLGLMGTKLSCGMQVCGVCTVLVDDVPVSSCCYLAADVDGSSVRTIEGLGDGGRLHPIQQAFVEASALQCGYCTPGFIMSTFALLLEHEAPDDATIREYLDGNLCRCTGYEQILRAVRRALEIDREGPGSDA